MLNATRTKYDAYTQQIGKLNNVADPSRAFEVLPAIAQTLRAKLKGSSDFLSKINIIPVVAQEGDKVGVGVKGTIASRTDTRTKDRSPRYPGDLDETRYRCEKTDFDTLIRYETLDAWAHQPNFQTLLRDAIVSAKAVDIITIGFNGLFVAKDTDPVAYPLLQDVNKGWLQHIREDAPERHAAGGELKAEARDADGVVTAAGAIYVGAGEVGTEVDYVNIDALVFAGIELLHENYREDMRPTNSPTCSCAISSTTACPRSGSTTWSNAASIPSRSGPTIIRTPSDRSATASSGRATIRRTASTATMPRWWPAS